MHRAWDIFGSYEISRCMLKTIHEHATCNVTILFDNAGLVFLYFYSHRYSREAPLASSQRRADHRFFRPEGPRIFFREIRSSTIPVHCHDANAFLLHGAHAFLLRPLPPPPTDTFAPLAFSWLRMSTAFWLPDAFSTRSVSLPRPISSTTLFGSAAPTTGTSEASHCWNGFAMK